MGKLLSLAIIIALIYFLIVPKFRAKKGESADTKDEQEPTALMPCDECGTYYEASALISHNSRQICKSCLAKIKEKK
ncbi:PP0621 family protein [Campylobacter sp. VBCF_01 NA2]|uniref:PP0621 family protein n=1 Tax=Campylobacter sp. VBCF_01 NA2 TaxID=2983836 RepID=UPI0022EA09C6|nr:PP0621 family protein [Campylobacter sp. VBCF_01 NA2]WBR53808.1 PP0621 family protein [Campylobacter sp. VBCF_01 NA2]